MLRKLRYLFLVFEVYISSLITILRVVPQIYHLRACFGLQYHSSENRRNLVCDSEKRNLDRGLEKRNHSTLSIHEATSLSQLNTVKNSEDHMCSSSVIQVPIEDKATDRVTPSPNKVIIQSIQQSSV